MAHRAKLYASARALKQNLRTDMGVSGPWQWGTIASVTSGSPFATVGVYLDTASGQTGATVTTNIPFLIGYKPTVGDVVLIGRMSGSARTQRIVLGTLASFGQGFSQAGVVFTPEVNMSGVATGKILLGTSGGGFRDSGDTVDALVFDSNQLATLRNALNIPPSAGGSIATTSYGSVPVKISQQAVSGVTGVTFSSIPGGFRALRVMGMVFGAALTAQQIILQMNSDVTGGDYSYTLVWFNPAYNSQNSNTLAYIPIGFAPASGNATIPSIFVTELVDYASTSTVNKTAISRFSQISAYGVAGGNQNPGFAAGYWHNSSTVTTLLMGLVGGAAFAGTFGLWGDP